MNVDRVRGHIERIAGFTASPGEGATRMSYSPEYRAACEYVMAHAAGLGAEARLDAIGSVRLRLPSSDAAAPAVLVGSHLDSVPHGGDLDGVLGVVLGLEVMEVLVREGVRPARPLEVIAFVEEEGATFRCPLAGSQLLTGALPAEATGELRDESGRSLAEAARAFACDPARLADDRLRPESVRAMLEVHIEQGRVLESAGVPVGIVECIAGSENHRLRLEGRADHAGTTPMPLRRDALAAAAEVVLAAERLAGEPARPDTVATVGRLLCRPNAANVVPGAVELSLDVRDVHAERLDDAVATLAAAIEAIAERRGLRHQRERTARSEPVACAPVLVELLEETARHLGISHRRLASGALHDAAILTRITEAAMLFVPSVDGASHVPEERTEDADIEQGAEVLLGAVRTLLER
ncbi:Zn-dependent hydrolase [Sediminicurvatus halobius]|uniref:Zn-dependent hydrolase n=1 Tax=Sediminicurvatus halobius TaxID=2182432 RepID=UPI001304E85C|nr:Zn-dependent hydrolase [Spiribacter halobius]